MLELDIFRDKPRRAQVGYFAVDHFRAGVRVQFQQVGEDGGGEDVAALRATVAENAVVEQVVGFVAMFAEKGRIKGLLRGLPGLEVPEIGGQRREPHRRINAAVGEKHRIAQGVIAKAATALPIHRWGNAARFASNDFLQARDAMGFGMFAHFNADPAAAHFMRDGGGSAGTEEGVENEVVRVSGDMENALNQTFWFWGSKADISPENFISFFL